MEACAAVATLLRPSPWVPGRCSSAAPTPTDWLLPASRESGVRWRFCARTLNAPCVCSVVRLLESLTDPTWNTPASGSDKGNRERMKSRRNFLSTASLGMLAATATFAPAQNPDQQPPGEPPAFGTGPAVGPEVSQLTLFEAEKLVQIE